jgi:hypothetical protein
MCRQTIEEKNTKTTKILRILIKKYIQNSVLNIDDGTLVLCCSVCTAHNRIVVSIMCGINFEIDTYIKKCYKITV